MKKLVLVCLLSMVASRTSQAHDDDRGHERCLHAPTGIPAELAVPANECLAEKLAASGVQIYTCTIGAWVLLAPEANLVDPISHMYQANHYLGPVWQSRDGSKIRGAKAAAAAAPNAPADIPWLLLNVTEETGPGRFADIKHVQRINTSGGVAPPGSCTDGSQVRVNYMANYLFYRIR